MRFPTVMLSTASPAAIGSQPSFKTRTVSSALSHAPPGPFMLVVTVKVG
jgi:hypothetical protein